MISELGVDLWKWMITDLDVDFAPLFSKVEEGHQFDIVVDSDIALVQHLCNWGVDGVPVRHQEGKQIWNFIRGRQSIAFEAERVSALFSICPLERTQRVEFDLLGYLTQRPFGFLVYREYVLVFLFVCVVIRLAEYGVRCHYHCKIFYRSHIF